MERRNGNIECNLSTTCSRIAERCILWTSADSRLWKFVSKSSSFRTSRRIASVSLKDVASSVGRSRSSRRSRRTSLINDLRFIRSHVVTSGVSCASRPKTLLNQCSWGPLSGFLTTCFASNAQMEREVTLTEMLSSSHKYCMRSIFAK